MKKINLIALGVVVITLLSSVLMAAPTESIIKNPAPITIRFATEATYPPFEYVDESGNLKGFEIDIAHALCNEIQAQCTFSVQSFDSLVPSLRLGKFDSLIAALGITPAREKEVSFTVPYYEPTASFVAPIAKHYTLQQLNRKIIGVQLGSTFEAYLHAQYPLVKIKTYSSVQDAFLDLISGRVDAVLSDSAIAKDWLKQDMNAQRFSIVDGPIIDHKFFGSGYGIAVRKQNTQLLATLNQALVKMKADGTYEKIYEKYFGNS